MGREPVVRQAREAKYSQPRLPLGIAKRVPTAIRIKCLEVVVKEYLAASCRNDENEAYSRALEEERALADRAASKSIYQNLIAGLRKRIRDQSASSVAASNQGASSSTDANGPEFVGANRVVSHDEILIGRAKGSFSVQKTKRTLADPAEMDQFQLYDRLKVYVMPPAEHEANGYPMQDPARPNMRLAPMNKKGQRDQLREQFASTYTCDRCSKVYRVDAHGIPLPTTSKCIYHSGHLWTQRIDKSLEKRFSCCKGDSSAGGCASNAYHVHQGELELENYTGYVETKAKPEWEPNKHGIYALDCEMCHTTYGLELSRITVINHKYEVVYERLVKPRNPIMDYNSKFSGINEGDLDEVTTRIDDVQADLLNMFSSKTILVGHSLNSDMKALKIFHKTFIDTAQMFPHKKGLPYKRALRTLMVENLQSIIQEDAAHDSKEDACAALKLVMWKAKTDVYKKFK